MAGNISRYPSNWTKICHNSFILRIVKTGYKLQFNADYVLPQSVISVPTDKFQKIALQNQISKFLAIGAISCVPKSPTNLLSRVFCVKKANGEDRMILDLSKLNEQIVKVSFKMEGRDTISDLLCKDDLMASIDLSDAFLSVPIHDSHKRYLAFEFDNKQYVFNVLPFGLTSSPRIFSKVLKPAIVYLRAKGIKISFYLDDIFICNSAKSLLVSHIDQTLTLLKSLGFTPNYAKSNLNPSKLLIHLGYLWNSESMSLSIPHDKICTTRVHASKLLDTIPTLRDISSFLGRVVSLSVGFRWAPLHYRHVQLQFCDLIKRRFNWEDLVSLNCSSLSDLSWWKSCPSVLTPVSLVKDRHDFTLTTDASKLGWGGFLSSGSQTSGLWSGSEQEMHINNLELLAVFNCVCSFLDELKNSKLGILSDNITTVYYINKLGGTQSKDLCLLALELWQTLIKNNIDCEAHHIPGVCNVRADSLVTPTCDNMH